jgi:hypothetical protein
LVQVLGGKFSLFEAVFLNAGTGPGVLTLDKAKIVVNVNKNPGILTYCTDALSIHES